MPSMNRLKQLLGTGSISSKRLFVPLLLLVCFAPLESPADSYNDFVYNVSGTNVTITEYTGSDKSVVIPSSIPGVGFVTGIGEEAFCDCVSLTGLVIPDTVTSIGDEAFSGCTSLLNVVIPPYVTFIGGSAFYYCTNLEAVDVHPDNTVYSSLNGVLFNKNRTLLILCPCGLAGAYAIPSTVTSIGEDAFCYCGSLTNLFIPPNVTSIPDGVCYGCVSLRAFSVDQANLFYSDLDGVLFNKSQCQLIEYPPGRSGAYSIPNRVASISGGAFATCEGLTSVAIPDSVSSLLAGGTFYSCRNLTNVAIGNNVTNIPVKGFPFCTKLTTITIPSNVCSLGAGAFGSCTNLSSAYFQGDAPSCSRPLPFEDVAAGFTVFYPSTASGWSTPTWEGHRALPYYYLPPEQRPSASLTQTAGALAISFQRLQVGTNYQLQASSDLNTWSNTGAVFAATNPSQAYMQPLGAANLQHLYFRLMAIP